LLRLEGEVVDATALVALCAQPGKTAAANSPAAPAPSAVATRAA